MFIENVIGKKMKVYNQNEYIISKSLWEAPKCMGMCMGYTEYYTGCILKNKVHRITNLLCLPITNICGIRDF